MDSELLNAILLYALPVLLAVTVHEAAHGYAARHFGDNTAWMMGRLTLNPIKHIDPVGTIAVPLVLLLLHSPFLFGWARPVPVNFNNLKNPKRDMVWVALAGPGVNMAMMVGWALVFKMGVLLGGSEYAYPMQQMATFGVMFNALLTVFNLLPIPPLDGGRVAVGLLPRPYDHQLSRLEPFGLFIVMGLAFTGVLSIVLQPLLHLVTSLLYFLG